MAWEGKMNSVASTAAAILKEGRTRRVSNDVGLELCERSDSPDAHITRSFQSDVNDGTVRKSKVRDVEDGRNGDRTGTRGKVSSTREGRAVNALTQQSQLQDIR